MASTLSLTDTAFESMLNVCEGGVCHKLDSQRRKNRQQSRTHVFEVLPYRAALLAAVSWPFRRQALVGRNLVAVGASAGFARVLKKHFEDLNSSCMDRRGHWNEAHASCCQLITNFETALNSSSKTVVKPWKLVLSKYLSRVL